MAAPRLEAMKATDIAHIECSGPCDKMPEVVDGQTTLYAKMMVPVG